ncbi:unnamed protein product, partial [marine sediment metagenome]
MLRMLLAAMVLVAASTLAHSGPYSDCDFAADL